MKYEHSGRAKKLDERHISSGKTLAPGIFYKKLISRSRVEPFMKMAQSIHAALVKGTYLHWITRFGFGLLGLPFELATAVIHSTLDARICGPVFCATRPSGIAQAALKGPPFHTLEGGWMRSVTQKCEPPGRPGSAAGLAVVSNGFRLADTVRVTSTHTRNVPSSVTVSRAGLDSGRHNAEFSSSVVWWLPARVN